MDGHIFHYNTSVKSLSAVCFLIRTKQNSDCRGRCGSQEHSERQYSFKRGLNPLKTIWFLQTVILTTSKTKKFKNILFTNTCQVFTDIFLHYVHVFLNHNLGQFKAIRLIQLSSSITFYVKVLYHLLDYSDQANEHTRL